MYSFGQPFLHKTYLTLTIKCRLFRSPVTKAETFLHNHFRDVTMTSFSKVSTKIVEEKSKLGGVEFDTIMVISAPVFKRQRF